MLNIIYIYPQIIEINNEVNLLRIVDIKNKESIVIYYVNNDVCSVHAINTMTGESYEIAKVNGLKEIELIIKHLKIKENEILSLNTLENTIKYILNIL